MRPACLTVRIAALVLIAAIAAPRAGHAETGDKAVGRKKALQCQTCHGLDGIAKIPEAANLAGQSEVYLVSALSAFKSGERKNDTMSIIAATLSPQDIADLAAYYSSIQVTVTPPKP